MQFWLILQDAGFCGEKLRLTTKAAQVNSLRSQLEKWNNEIVE